MRISQATTSNQNGFTLIEIIIVLTIIALFATVVIPRFRDTLDLELKKEARILSGSIRFLYQQAVVKHKTYRLHYDLDNGAYSVESSSKNVYLTSQEKKKSIFEEKKAPSTFQEDKELFKKPQELRKKIKFKEIQTEESHAAITSGSAYTHFFPMGYAEKTKIKLETTRGNIYTLVVQPLTGSTKIYTYDIDNKE